MKKMSCPTCDHTMHKVAFVFHCPRCGTMRHGDDIYAPTLVDRVRLLLDQTTNDDLAWSLGVTESICKAGDARRYLKGQK